MQNFPRLFDGRFEMMNYYGREWAIGAGVLLLILVVWSVVWKGLALWKAAREGNKHWFIALLLINTAGILEILYLYVFSKKSDSK